MIFYTNWVGDKFAGMTIGPFIFIRPEYRHDEGLLAHEKVHVKQFWRYWGFSWVLYFLSAKYRYQFEFEAYRVQLLYSSDVSRDIERFAGFIFKKYNLNVDINEVVMDLAR